MDQLELSLKRFAEAVFADAENEKKATVSELDTLKKEKFSKIEDSLLKDSYDTIQTEVVKIKNASQLKISEETQNSRAALLARRAEIENCIFDTAAKKIAEFAASDEYLPFLLKSLRALKAEFEGAPCTLVLRPLDMCFADELCAVFEDCKATAGEESLGGFTLRCPSKNIIFDDTFQSKLEAGRNEFRQKSGLFID